MTSPVLVDGNLRIRQYQIMDAESLHAAAMSSWQETVPFMPWCHRDYSLEMATAWIVGQHDAWERGTEFSFMIEDAESGAYLGGVGINKIDREYRICNVGYWTAAPSRLQGIARKAVPRVIAWSFEKLDMIRVEIVVSVHNLASVNVARSIGAVEEGILRKRLILHGESHDAHMFSVVLGDAMITGLR